MTQVQIEIVQEAGVRTVEGHCRLGEIQATY
jgi:hypothetical protein